MNRFKIGFLAIALLMVIPSFGKGIKWKGNWYLDRKSSIIHIPIIGNIEQTSQNLTLEFIDDLGNVDVIISDQEGNIVYQETIQTETTPQICISLKDLPIKEGVISVTDGENLVYGFINF